MKTIDNQNGSITLIADEGKRLLHILSGRYVSEAEIEPEKASQFVEKE